MADLTFRTVMANSLIFVVGLALMLNFSLSVFDNHNADIATGTLEEVKGKANATSPTAGQVANDAQNVTVSSGNFLSPQGFSVISNAFDTIVNIPTILTKALGELGFPPVLQLLGSIVVIAMVWEIISLLFGVRT